MSGLITITTFYSFAPVAEPAPLREPILERMETLGIRGTITLAREGVNATISGEKAALAALIDYVRVLTGITTEMARESYFGEQPFQRSKVKVKPELISIGVPTYPAACVGTYVTPKDWNALITSLDVIIIDTRNDYEFDLGHFKDAVNPGTGNFKEMVRFTEENLLPVSGRRIAMYCTGGIRCDKYSSYLVALGFTEVYHLRGGILAYLEQIRETESRWNGSCFVFDARRGVGHGLQPMQEKAA